MNVKSTSGSDTANSTSDSSEEVVLTERQLEILESVGLSQNYDELLSSQKNSIMAIEELLSSVEEKYGIELCYAGYVQEGILEDEHAIAYPADGFKEIDCFTITRESDGSISDEYMEVALREPYSELFESIAKEILGIEDVEAYAEVASTSLTSVPDDVDELARNVAGEAVIFVDGAVITEEQCEAFVASMEDALKEKQMYCGVDIILLNPDTLKYLTRFNYADYLKSDYYTIRESIRVTR